MTTIEAFEQSLGRRVLWSPRHEPADRSTWFVRRLRNYPHALRSQYAYYDPERIAILLGYVPTPAAFNVQNVYPEGVSCSPVCRRR